MGWLEDAGDVFSKIDPIFSDIVGVPTNGPDPIGMPNTTEAEWLNREATRWELDAHNKNQAQIDGLGALGSQTAWNTDFWNTQQWNGIGEQQGYNDAYMSQSRDLLAQLGGATNQANAFDWQNQAMLDQALGQASGGYNSALAGYQGAYNSIGGMQDSGVRWAGDLQSQAARAYADPASIAAQNQALGQLQGAAGGSLNINTQNLAGYGQLNQSIASLQGVGAGSQDQFINQMAGYQQLNDSIAQLQGVGRGSQDQYISNFAGYNQLQDFSKGANDVSLKGNAGYQQLLKYMNGDPSTMQKVGEADPEAYAALVDARGKYKDLTDTEVTAQERFIYEQARSRQEQDERNMRAAVATNARMSGMSGGGGEAVARGLGAQQSSQNRLLSDLGAQANAITRSMDALQGYAGVSDSMNAQANAIAAGNRDRQFSATGTAGGMQLTNDTNNMDRRFAATGQLFNTDAQVQVSNADRRVGGMTAAGGLSSNLLNTDASVRTANADRRVSGMQSAGGLSASLLNTDAQVQSANSDRRLGAMTASGQLASSMRQSSFDEAYKRGAAADQTAQFNRMGSLSVDTFNATYKQNERDALWARTNDLYAAQHQNVTDQLGLQKDAYVSRNATNATTFGRQKDLIGATDSVNTRQHGLNTDITNRKNAYYDDQVQAGKDRWTIGQTQTAAQIGQNTAVGQTRSGDLTRQAGIQIAKTGWKTEADAAERAAKIQAEANRGLF